MIHSLLTPVKIISESELDGRQLASMVRFITSIGERTLNIAIVRDDYPMPARAALVEALRAEATVTELTDVSPNPLSADIDRMLAAHPLAGCDAVIGIGGGSVLDSAKALAMLAKNGGSLDEYLGPAATRKIEAKGLPLILVPTTAGTGSEVTKVGVFTSATGRKFTLGSPLLLADAAVLCGALTHSMPPSLTAATGFDALDHALESIWNKNATAITRKAASEAAVEVLENLDAAYDASTRTEKPLPGDAEARQNMLEASCKAGVAFSITGTAAGHALSFILSEEWHVPHGAACAFTLEEIYGFALGDDAVAAEIAKIAAHFFPGTTGTKELCALLLGKIRAMKARMKLGKTFAELKVAITKEDIPRFFDRSFTDPKMLNQLPVATPALLYPLLEAKI